MTPEPDRAEALADLRRAYRLVWAYQRQTLDMVQIVADAFGDLAFYRWVSRGQLAPPNPKQTPLGRWSWDFLPLRSASTLFASEGVNRRGARVAKGDWLLEVTITADSGFACGDDDEEPDARHFADAATDSYSTLDLVAWLARADIEGTWRDDAWGLAIDEPVTVDHGEVASHEEPPLSALRMTWHLEDLATHEDLDNALEEFKAALRARLGLVIS